MAAPFTDYSPIPGHADAFQFATPDGSMRTLTGPAALQVKRSIDSTRQLAGPTPPGPVAPPPAQPAILASAFSPTPQPAGPANYAAEFANAPSVPDPHGWGGAKPETAPASAQTGPLGMPQTQQAAQLPPGQQTPGAGGISMPRYASVKDGTLDTTTGLVSRAGSPGASKAQIEAEKKAQAEQMAHMTLRAEESEQRTQEKTQILAENADAQQRFMEEQRSKAETAAFNEEIHNREIADRVTQERGDVEAKMADYRAAKVDPDRIFKGEKGGTNKLTTAISVMLGAIAHFGQGLMGNANGTNPGITLVNKRIDDDIREQEREIGVKKESKDNALAQLSRSLGDMQQAKLGLKAMQTDVALSKMNELANATKSPLLRNQLGESMAILQAQKEAALGEFARLGALKLRAMRGSGPSVRAATLDEIKTVGGIRATDAGTEKTGVEAFSAAQKAAAAAANGGEDAKPVTTERTSKINNSVQALVAATQLEQRLQQEKPSDWSEPSGSKTPAWLPGTDAGTNYSQLESATLNAAMLKQKSLDLGSTEDDFQRAKEAMIGNGSVNARVKGAQGAAAEAARAAAAELATLPPADQSKVLNAMPAEVAARIRSAAKPEVTRER